MQWCPIIFHHLPFQCLGKGKINYQVAVNNNIEYVTGTFFYDRTGLQILPYTLISYTFQANVNQPGTHHYNFKLSMFPPSSSISWSPYNSYFDAYGAVQDVIGNFSLLHEAFGATDEVVVFQVSPHQGTQVWYEWTWETNNTDRYTYVYH